jgi:hypothetical protein
MSGVAERERYGWKLALAALLNVLLGPALLGIVVFVLLRVYPAKPAVVGLAAVLAFVFAILIVWAVLFFKFTQNRTVLRGTSYFFVLLGSSAAVIIVLVSLGNLNDKATRTEADAREVAQVRLVLAEGDKAVAVAIGEHGGTTDLHTGGNDEAGRIARAAKTLLRATSEAERVSLDKLDRIHFPAFMAPASFKNDPNFERARKHILDTRAAIDEHEQAMA